VGDFLPNAVWFDAVGIDIHGVETAKVGETGWVEANYTVTTPNANLG
jgi:hypothetical protein